MVIRTGMVKSLWQNFWLENSLLTQAQRHAIHQKKTQWSQKIIQTQFTLLECTTHQLPPVGFDMEFLGAEFREGGSCFFRMSNHAGVTFHGQLEYHEINKPFRIVYVQRFCDEYEKVARHPGLPVFPQAMLGERRPVNYLKWSVPLRITATRAILLPRRLRMPLYQIFMSGSPTCLIWKWQSKKRPLETKFRMLANSL